MQQKMTGQGLFIEKKMTGQALFFWRKNDGARTFFEAEKILLPSICSNTFCPLPKGPTEIYMVPALGFREFGLVKKS